VMPYVWFSTGRNTQYLKKIVKFTFRRDALKALKFLKSIIDAGKLITLLSRMLLLFVCSLLDTLFDIGADYRHGIRLATSVDAKILITLNARSENDRTKFVEDLKEAILEVDELLLLLPISFLTSLFSGVKLWINSRKKTG